MPHAVEVQVRSCKLERSADNEDNVVWCADTEAAFFSVYTGEPGNFIWDADFGNKLVAIQFAKDNALRLGADFVDHTGDFND